MKILAFAASLRKESFNKKLLRLAVEWLRETGTEVDEADFGELAVPTYNQDSEDNDGFPAGARELKRRLDLVDGFCIASPEYNWSIPGSLKNLIDWTSRMRPSPFRGKAGLILSASTGPYGGVRMQVAIRAPMDCNGVLLAPGGFSLPFAAQSFDAENRLKNPDDIKRLHSALGGFLGMVKKN
jgi:chromate reductase, NAD(P)H dehydrogenase (quinone)